VVSTIRLFGTIGGPVMVDTRLGDKQAKSAKSHQTPAWLAMPLAMAHRALAAVPAREPKGQIVWAQPHRREKTDLGDWLLCEIEESCGSTRNASREVPTESQASPENR
jgi:hypothetical protein